MDAPAVFASIYEDDRWNGGSGPGSRLRFCRPLVRWLRGYLAEHRIRSLVDLGCGDLQWMPAALADLDVTYTGLDVVESVLDRHRQHLPANRWAFELVDVATAPIEAIPTADLYWAKDVLQHWPSASITAWLRRFFRARPKAHLVVCNCHGQTASDRQLDAVWHFAPLDPSRPPLAEFHEATLFSWGGKTVVRLGHQRSSTGFPETSDDPVA
jgi:hypothetical protein